MSLAALALAAAASLAAPPPESGARVTAQARVSAVIVEPAVVRQASGLEASRAAPRVQVTRRGREVFFEFQ